MAQAGAPQMMDHLDADVLVVGAGPAGSAVSLHLARRGYRVIVLDRAKFPRPKPCGEYLNPGAVDALERLGVLATVARSGASVSGMYVAAPDGRAAWAPFPEGRGLLVPRNRLDHLLVAETSRAGATVIEECRVHTVSAGKTPVVTGRHRDRSIRLAARLVIGADGLRSIVARRGGPLRPPPNGHYTVGAHFENLQAPAPRGDLHLGRGCYAGAALYGGGIGNIVVAVPRSAFRRHRGDADAVFAAASATLPILKAIVHGARRTSPFVSVGPLGYTARRATDDGLLLVGDAAGTIDPMTGEGLSLALRGAELAAHAADAALMGGEICRRSLVAYERARVAAFRQTWRISRFLQRVVRHPRLAAVLLSRLSEHPALASRLLGAVSDMRA